MLVLLLALHPLLLQLACTARMYALGIFFTGLSSLILWKSLHSATSCSVSLLLYGVTAGAFAWTHYFAFFTITAQLLFVVWYLFALTRQRETAQAGRWLLGACWSTGAILILTAPLLPLFLAQQQDVQALFWIPPVSWESVWRILVPWATGFDPWPQDVYLMLPWLCAVVVLVWHADRLAAFFLLQGVVPWVLAIGYSLITGRSILYDRYLSFACFAWVCFVGISWSRMPMGTTKALVGAFFGSMTLFAAVDYIGKWPTRPPPHEAAAAFLKEEYQEGDVCWVDWAPEVNTLRYYLAQEGMRDANVRCQFTRYLGVGHVVHRGSLSVHDFFEGDFPEGKRIWRCGPRKDLQERTPPGMIETLRRTWEGPKGSFYSIILFELAKK
ncbi:MAG: hypothetical protein L0Y72_11790 [Gemmataceae bacterium]|nr:hypothetical protein [Gemmataceae bacterium]